MLALVASLAGCDGGERVTATDAGAGTDGGAPKATEGGGACPFTEDTSGPTVSFKNDLMPFFSVTCAFGGCHDGATRSAGLYLGPNFTDGTPDAATRDEVLRGLLAPATTTPDLPRITPSDPGRSFLVLKIEGCQNQAGLTCSGALKGQPCGQRMPALSDPLPDDRRSLVVRWVAQGATGD